MVIAQILEFDHGMNSESSDFNHVILGKIYNLSESQFTDILNTPNCMVGVGVNGGKWFWQDFRHTAGIPEMLISCLLLK